MSDKKPGRRPTITREQYQRIIDVKVARAMLPSNKELAREFGISPSTVNGLMIHGLKTYDKKGD